MQGHYNVLFLCTGNSARSIMAEAILNKRGWPNFTAYSAGSHPSGTAHPEALKQLQAAGISTEGLRSKSWDEFALPVAPEMHFIFTVCDNAANEVCPVWPGHPITAHWGLPDPAAVKGSPLEMERIFRNAFSTLDRRIALFLSLPLDTLETMALQNRSEADRASIKVTLSLALTRPCISTRYKTLLNKINQMEEDDSPLTWQK